jgi:hypothetical protein
MREVDPAIVYCSFQLKMLYGVIHSPNEFPLMGFINSLIQLLALSLARCHLRMVSLRYRLS